MARMILHDPERATVELDLVLTEELHNDPRFADVKAAHVAFLDACDAYREKQHEAAEICDLLDDHRVAVRAAARAGTAPPGPIDPNYVAERKAVLHREIVAAVREAHRAGRAYEEFILDRRADLRDALMSALPEAHEEAVAAIRAAEHADARQRALVRLAASIDGHTARREGDAVSRAAADRLAMACGSVYALVARTDASRKFGQDNTYEVLTAWTTVRSSVTSFPVEGYLSADPFASSAYASAKAEAGLAQARRVIAAEQAQQQEAHREERRHHAEAVERARLGSDPAA